ncbi:hypothetical protein [Leptospira sp. GIMC2001]|uniref:hypothetical protein n=1 Tax=Leptospira sp. GIMC2001 TaxID=1513297 RepID=UPI002349849E|nr:hypothetical protein [Leptospira sp. GIMC2001]WCL51528.1 hypothetical protein O4O04_20135 [Leptospira sp. GIMC2001]
MGNNDFFTYFGEVPEKKPTKLGMGIPEYSIFQIAGVNGELVEWEVLHLQKGLTFDRSSWGGEIFIQKYLDTCGEKITLSDERDFAPSKAMRVPKSPRVPTAEEQKEIDEIDIKLSQLEAKHKTLLPVIKKHRKKTYSIYGELRGKFIYGRAIPEDKNFNYIELKVLDNIKISFPFDEDEVMGDRKIKAVVTAKEVYFKEHKNGVVYFVRNWDYPESIQAKFYEYDNLISDVEILLARKKTLIGE